MPKSAKNTRFVVTVPQEEYTALMAWLPQEGYSLSAFVRMAVRDAARARGLDLDLVVTPGGERADRRPDARD